MILWAKPGLEPGFRLGSGFIGLRAGLGMFVSPEPFKPSPSPGFEPKPGPHITSQHGG